ncbi:50S ribosomal protein L17 [Patescibacteria group bacterium]|nr:50S ribosomal protein L17 [Patescibacteria group bacterium]
MRHRKNKRKIGAKANSQNKLLYRNLTASLILNEKLKTTTKKARLLQPIIEKLITLSRQSDLSTKRRLQSLLNNKTAEKKLKTELSKKYKNKPGGYTRILKLDRRQGDGATMVQIELL